MSIIFFLKPHYRQPLRSLMPKRKVAKRRKVYKITYRYRELPKAEQEEIPNYIFKAMEGEPERIKERRAREEEEETLLLQFMLEDL